MSRWLKRIRGAVGMGLTWAIPWSFITVILGLIQFPAGPIRWGWVASGAYPGFLAGVMFSVVIRLAEGRQRLDQLSLTGVGACGVLAGALLGSVPFIIGSPVSSHPNLLLVVMVGSSTLLSMLSAAGTLALARRADRKELVGADEALAAAGLTANEMRELLGSGAPR